MKGGQKAYMGWAGRPDMLSEIASDPKLEIAHVLTMDLVEYSTLLITDQTRVMADLNKIVRSTPRFLKAEAAEKLIRIPTGDGMALVFFNDPEAPLECAMEIAAALKNHSEIRLRMGIHSGPINPVIDVNDRSNVAGAGIDMAQRVMDCGDAGHILLSKHVADDLSPYPRWSPYLHDLGDCEIKHGRKVSLVNFYTDELGNRELPNKLKLAHASLLQGGSPPRKSKSLRFGAIAGAMLGALVLGYILYHVAGLRLASRPPAEQLFPEKSIAVLPFENLSEDKANAYFAEGIQDEILTRLSKIADLKVISRTSTQHYKSAGENLSEVGKQLHVAHIVEGNVQRNGDAVRINVQLIKAADDSHLWAETFDRKLTDIFSVESEVAKAIADQLRVHFTGREEQIINAKPTDNPEAYDAYLRGLAYSLKTGLSPADQIAAQSYLREAVRLDPKFALAWALLSQADAVGYVMLFLQPTPALREEARQAADTALDLQPNLAEALVAKGWYHYGCLKDYDTAVRYFQRARQLLPNNSQIPEALAYVARRRGEWDRSEVYFNEAERVDPRNLSLLTQHAFSYIFLGRFPEALRKLDQALTIVPDDTGAIVEKALVAQAEGDLPRAAILLDPLRPTASDPFTLEAQVYQRILERQPSRMITRLNEVLANPDPTLGYLNGELRFWLGWAQDLAGDHVAAQETWRRARDELENFLKEQPENYVLIGDLALTNMALGNKAVALTLAERAIAANPIEKDAMDGSLPIEILARVAAQTGESDRAVAALNKVLSIPGAGAWALNIPLTPALLRLDPMFDPLRTDRRFQQLVASAAPVESK